MAPATSRTSDDRKRMGYRETDGKTEAKVKWTTSKPNVTDWTEARAYLCVMQQQGWTVMFTSPGILHYLFMYIFNVVVFIHLKSAIFEH